MKRILSIFTALVLCLSVVGTTQAGLETNGGFETGDFTGWTLGGNNQFNSVSGPTADVFGLNPYQGSYFALLGSPTGGGVVNATNGDGVVLSQNIATTAGDQYTFSFAYFIEPGAPNYFGASFGGTAVLNDINDVSFTADGNGNIIWQPESYLVTATGPTTTIAFYSGNAPDYNGLDSVSVTPVSSPTPEPASVAVWGLGLAAAFFASRRRKALKH